VGVPDAIFADPRLAPLYDAFDGDRSDLDHYVAMVDEFDALSVLDVGCGTGTLACLLAAKGIKVVGVDAAEASLAVARLKPQSSGVQWILGEATSLPPLQADLATMTGNAAQVFLTDDEWYATLVSIRHALRPTGRLVFEARDPSRRAWERWNRDTSWCRRNVAGVGSVETWVQVTDVTLPLVSFTHTYVFDDGTIVTSDSTLRFRDRDELAASLHHGGYRVLDIRDAPDRPGHEFVFVAEVTEAAKVADRERLVDTLASVASAQHCSSLDRSGRPPSARVHRPELACSISDVWRTNAAKSASLWRIGVPVRMATAAMRQSMSFRTVSPLRRQSRYSAAASS
jgi:SAM-dependent methyltransferase